MRTFSKRAGFQSPNFYKLVMDGKRNLTEESLPKFMVGLNLNKQEQDFFRHLVFFNQAGTHEAKDYYYQKLLQSKKFNQLKPIEKDQYDFYSSWYHPVVRELVTCPQFDGTPQWLAEKISPAITVAQAKKSLELLEKLNFIKKNDKGHWIQKTNLVSTGPESTSLVLLNYHQGLLDLAKLKLKEIEPSQRDISALTLGVTKDKIPLLKKKIQEFRQDILKLVSTDVIPEEVLLFSMQLFPATHLLKDDKAS